VSVEARLDALWAVRRGPGGGADRPAFSSAEAEAMRLVAGWAEAAGLVPGIDSFGNLWALPPGDGPVVTSGSHVDTVPDGGRLDGALGTVLALAAAARVEGAGVLVCAAEESPRFGAGTLGSRALWGELSVEGLRDAAGVAASAARAEYLDALGDLPRVTPALERVVAHVEVHVEQRRWLAGRGVRLGVARGIAGAMRFGIEIAGAAGHAGEVPMTARRDALAAGAELVLAAEAAALAEPGCVATVGALEVQPGAGSVIPGRVVASLDVRAEEADAIERVVASVAAAGTRTDARRGTVTTWSRHSRTEPVPLSAPLRRAALAAAARRGAAAMETLSGAGHDVGSLAARVPGALLLVPLVEGESHTPVEVVRAEDVSLALEVLCDVLAEARSRPLSPTRS
jgi:hydantoinase/carbamoylase family amidase